MSGGFLHTDRCDLTDRSIHTCYLYTEKEVGHTGQAHSPLGSLSSLSEQGGLSQEL